MKNFFSERMSAFWISIMEKLNTDKREAKIHSEILEELCTYFRFGCGFIYIADSKGRLLLRESYKVYSGISHVKDVICLKDKIGVKLYEELLHQKYVAFDETKKQSELDKALGAEFQGKALILVPLTEKHKKIRAMIGMVDRRGQAREGDQDIRFAYTVMSVIANYIKVLISQQESSGTMNVLMNVLDHTGVDVYVSDFYTDEILYANQSMEEQHGGRQNIKVLTSVPKDKLLDKHKSPTEVQIWNQYFEEENVWRRMLCAAFYWVDGRLAIVCSSIDITENKKNEAKIRYHVEYDMLTGLANRHKLLLDCDDGIERLKRENREGYLIFCDLNKFKDINDTLGHQVGDELLAKIGAFLAENPHTSGSAYRYGGDEFIILCFDHTKEEVDALIDSVVQRFEKPWKLSEHEVWCGTSVGITRYPQDAATTSDLLHSADMAMYQVKLASH